MDATSKPDEGAARRIRPGTKAADMATGPPLVLLSELDSPFQLQEHLKSLYASLTHSPESAYTVPVTRETALQLASPPQMNDSETVDRNLYLFEICRFLTQKANIVSIFLMNDNPPCSSTTCPEMRASEWQYLCAVHEPPKSCCAIDYCNHTLDWAANVLTSPKHFPSRLALGGEAGNVIQSMRQLTNIFRRVYRIFAHAWFQHRDVFWAVEATYGLYMFFKVVCDEYHLIPEDSYTIPPEAEGGAREVDDEGETDPPPQILQKHNTTRSPDEPSGGPTSSEQAESDVTATVSTAATTRRHKHTPSTGSHVATIAEGAEEEEEPTSTISTKPLGVPHLIDIEGPTTAASSEKRKLSPQLRKDGDRSPGGRLPKLNIASSVPAYEPRAPEDPTPTNNSEDIDPLSVHHVPKLPSSSSSANPESDPQKDSPASKRQPDTPIDQITRPFSFDDDEGPGHKVTSPSGGSIRTAGNDVLAAIMGHIHDGDDEGGSPPNEHETQSFSPQNFSPLHRRGSEPLRDVNDEENAQSKADEVVENDDNENMSPVHASAPAHAADAGDEGKGQEEHKESEEQEPVADSHGLGGDEVVISVEETLDHDEAAEQAIGDQGNEHVKVAGDSKT